MLIADPASEWMRLALPVILQEDLATSQTLLPSVVNADSAAYQFGSTAVLRTTLEIRRGRISIQATVTDTSNQRSRQVIRVEEDSSVGLLPAANALAKQIDDRATEFSTRNARALQAYTAAAESTNSQTRIEMLDEAINVDPNFGLGYITLAEIVGRTREQDLSALLRTGATHAPQFTPLDRARFNALRTQLSNASLEEQQKAQTSVLQLAPNNADALIALGTDQFLEGNSGDGRKLFAKALDLSPGNANIRNQLARELLDTRQFGDAEKLFASLNNNAPVLPELATCVLLEGDQRRADAIANQFVDSVPDEVKQEYRAAWLALTGRLDQAIETMRGFSDPAAALVQIAIWQLMQGDFANAKKNASLAAMQPAKGNNSLVTVAALLSEGDQPPEQWREKVNVSALNDPSKQALLGYGFFLYAHYSQAADVWRKLLDESGGADLRARAMLASSLNHAGRGSEARNILVQPFVPEFRDLYAAIAFREMRRLLKLEMK